MALTRESFERIHRSGQDARTRERMLPVLNVAYQGMVAAHVARDLHRCKAWACEWPKRYHKEGTDGLRSRPKSGRPPELSEEVSYIIKKGLKESNQGWTTKQVEEMVVKESGGIKYHHTHTCRTLRRWGFKQKVPRKVHVNTASQEEKYDFKKRPQRYLWVSSSSKKKERKKKASLP